MGVPAGTYKEYPATQKSTFSNNFVKNTNSSSYTVYKGLDHSLKLNSVHNSYRNSYNHHNCNDYSNNYDGDYGQQSFLGGLFKEALPFLVGAGISLLIPALFGGEGGLGGFLSNLFGGKSSTKESNQPEENALTKMESQLEKLTAKNEELEKAITDMKAAAKPVEVTKAPGTQQPPVTGTKEETKVAGASQESKPEKYKVKPGDTIFTMIEAEVKKQNPNVSKPELDKLVAKTIEANKALLEANNKAKPVYNEPPRKLGDYI